MNKVLFWAAVFLSLAGIACGCSAPVTPAPATHAAFSLPTLIPPTAIPPTPTAVPTATNTPVPPTQTSLPPTATASPPLATVTEAPRVEASQTPPAQVTAIAASSVVTPSPAPSPTLLPPTPSPSPSPTVIPTPVPSAVPAIRPGVYVTDMRIDPPPVRGPDLKFYATFLNSMDREQNYRWAVYIFRADTQRGTGETSRTDSTIPTGTAEELSNGAWKLPLGGPCDYFYAQVGWINPENKAVWFTTPAGAVFQKGFTVCPP